MQVTTLKNRIFHWKKKKNTIAAEISRSGHRRDSKSQNSYKTDHSHHPTPRLESELQNMTGF